MLFLPVPHLFPRVQLLSLLPLSNDFGPTCMSQPSQSSAGDELGEITFRFQNLSITVRGPISQAVDFSQQYLGRSQDTGSVAAASVDSRASVEASFVPCPTEVLALSNQLSRTNKFSARQRIERAFRAGQWAAATRQGRVATPNRSPTIDLPNRCYAVLWTPDRPSAPVHYSSRDFFSVVGDLDSSEAICHGFPSQSEARAYFAGAEVDFPRVEPN